MIQDATSLARTQAFILAGGQGDRLQPLTISRPKPAVSFGGIFRIIDFTLSNCLYSALRRVSVLTQYKHDVLHRYLRNGWMNLWQSTVGHRVLECLPPVSGKRYRGTADAVFQNAASCDVDSEFVLVLSGDHIYQMDYRDLLRQHVETNADMTIAAVEHPVAEASNFGVIEVDNNCRVTGFEEKPAQPRPMPSDPSSALVSMGVYVFKKTTLLSALNAMCGSGLGFDFGRDVIPRFMRDLRAYAYDFRDEKHGTPHYWRDIGTIDGYHAASMDLVEADAAFDPYANDTAPSEPTRHPNAASKAMSGPRLFGNARIKRTILSPDVQVEENAAVEDSVLMPGVRIGKGAQLRRVVVEEGVHVPSGVQVGFDPESDRSRFTVTESGVVVISEQQEARKPVRFAITTAFGGTRRRDAIVDRMTASA
jgi:glucose-1-phosphate adenylyltransferase